MKHRIEEDDVKQFTEMLREQEKSRATIETYTRSVNSLRSWIGKDSEFDKNSVIAFKAQLRERYKLNTANTYIASLNSFFKFMGWHDCSLTTYKLQRKTFRDADKEITIEEYGRILEAARHLPHDRLFLSDTDNRKHGYPCRRIAFYHGRVAFSKALLHI